MTTRWSDFDTTTPEDRARIAKDREGKPGCTLAGPGRGDCSHFVGLPGYSIPGQHDGPDTEDHYGKPNGWCWSCWKDRQLDQTRDAARQMYTALRAIRDMLVKMHPSMYGMRPTAEWLKSEKSVREIMKREAELLGLKLASPEQPT